MRFADRVRRWSVRTTLLAGVAMLLSSCASDQHFTLLGYTTAPNYDCNIKTVYVPVFKNLTMYRGLEFELTQAVVRDIELQTPFKVTSDEDTADTVLKGTIVTFRKNYLNLNEDNELRDVDTTLAVEVVWTDRRTGEVLSAPGRKAGLPPLPPPEPGAPPLPPPRPVLITTNAQFEPELGGSIRSARQQNVNRMARKIVGLMEQPW